jgi:hypothetical protein
MFWCALCAGNTTANLQLASEEARCRRIASISTQRMPISHLMNCGLEHIIAPAACIHRPNSAYTMLIKRPPQAQAWLLNALLEN